jgi:hypothetical protein
MCVAENLADQDGHIAPYNVEPAGIEDMEDLPEGLVVKFGDGKRKAFGYKLDGVLYLHTHEPWKDAKDWNPLWFQYLTKVERDVLDVHQP